MHDTAPFVKTFFHCFGLFVLLMLGNRILNVRKSDISLCWGQSGEYEFCGLLVYSDLKYGTKVLGFESDSRKTQIHR